MVNGGYNPTTATLGLNAGHVYGSEPINPVLSRIADYLGVLMAHEDERYQSVRMPIALGNGYAAGRTVLELPLGFQAKSITIDNPSGYTLVEPSLFQLIPPNVYDYPIRIDAAIAKIVLNVVSGTQATAVTGYIRASEARIMPIPLLSSFAAAFSGVTIGITPNLMTDGSGTITAGGTAQTVFAVGTVINGYEIINPDPGEDLWLSDTATPVANGTGSIRVAANGGGYTTPLSAQPVGAVQVVAATTGHKFTARKW